MEGERKHKRKHHLSLFGQREEGMGQVKLWKEKCTGIHDREAIPGTDNLWHILWNILGI